MCMRSYEKLIAWQEAFQLCLRTYEVTRTFPSDERFSLTNQMRRASTSVCMNIAEGSGKKSKKDTSHFLDIALGSLEELHCQYRISLGLSYINQQRFNEADEHIHRVGYLLHKLQESLS